MRRVRLLADCVFEAQLSCSTVLHRQPLMGTLSCKSVSVKSTHRYPTPKILLITKKKRKQVCVAELCHF